MCDRIETDRRTLVKALLTAQALLPTAQASGRSPSEGNDAAGNLIIQSGLGFVPHTHDLLIPHAVLRVPPRQGVKLVSTVALFHAHDVVLTREQLIVVSQGGTITAIGGSHSFVIALANAKSP
jgi:hypothetical protein